jgi:two-component system sensor histidine kinase UhpB
VFAARHHRPVDLKRRLLLRVTLFALTLALVSAAALWQQAVERIRGSADRTGETVQRLVNDEIARSTTAFDRQLEHLSLSGLDGIGELVPFCATIENIYRQPLAQRCYGTPAQVQGFQGGVVRSLSVKLQAQVGEQGVFRGSLGTLPGVKIADLTVSPHYDSEALTLYRQLQQLVAVIAGVLLINVLIYRPVRRALAPSEAILNTLEKMRAGDLDARMPPVELVELDSIARGFNHLAERLQQTLTQQRQLAQRLLHVREEERKHLARELHDELGQCLASIQAEAAFAGELARDGVPALLPCADAIAHTTARMMEVLQQILHKLRPVGLEEFGLEASLKQLVESWNHRGRGRCGYRLVIDGDWSALGDDLNISIYRIVQESLTNAAKHGHPSTVTVTLSRVPGQPLAVTVDDDGKADEAGVMPSGLTVGHGLLGMHERVQALGGELQVLLRSPSGMRISVRLPEPGGAAVT